MISFVLFGLAYSEIYFGDPPALKIFQVAGRADIPLAVGNHLTVNEPYSMAGWRMGFAVRS